MKSNSILTLFASNPGLVQPPIVAASSLALMLVWSQASTAKLKGLPSFKDASADFLSREPIKIAKALCPEFAGDIADALKLEPSEIEDLRRTLLIALESQNGPDEIAGAILQFCMPEAWIPKEVCDILLMVLDARENSSIRCSFSHTLHAAWDLSERCAVELDVEHRALGRVISLLAYACSRHLKVNENTIDSVAREGRTTNWDHALIFPPLGGRLRQDHTSASVIETVGSNPLGTEAFGARWGSQLGRRRNIVVVGNGFLFRTSSKDAAFKQRLVYDYGLEAVIALPRGTLQNSSITVSALVFGGEHRSKTRKNDVRFINAGNLDHLDAATVAALLDAKAKHHLCADASFDELLSADFNLSVDRYVLDLETIKNRNLLRDRETATLSDLAEIRRPQALPRAPGNEPGVEVHEALLADIDNSHLLRPKKLSEIPRTAFNKIESTVLKEGDILLSIKGTIGKTALVTGWEARIAEGISVPIVPGQSFVIIRLRKGSLIRKPEVLAIYLRTRLAQSLLKGMAGGTTVPNVAMGQLRHMPVLIPSAETQAEIVARFGEWELIQEQMEDLREQGEFVEAELMAVATGKSEQEGDSNANR